MQKLKANNNKNLLYIDVIKILSAIIIVLFHFDVHSFYANKQSLLLGKLTYFNVSLGDIGISLFIIMSGLTLALSANFDFSILKFYKKRILAIMPSFWMTYLIVAIVYLIFGKKIGDGHYWKIVLTFLGLDGFFLYRMTNFYLVGEWYTGYMLITYIFFPIIYFRMKITPILNFIILFLLSIILHLNYNHLFKIQETCNPLMRLVDFSFGMLFILYIAQNQRIRKVCFLISTFYMVLSNRMSVLLPYHYHMILTGFSIFIILEFIVSSLKSQRDDMLSKAIGYIASLTFLSFLIHHQIILFFYEKINNLSNMSRVSKLMCFIVILILSFSYAAVVQPIIKKITNTINKKIK